MNFLELYRNKPFANFGGQFSKHCSNKSLALSSFLPPWKVMHDVFFSTVQNAHTHTDTQSNKHIKNKGKINKCLNQTNFITVVYLRISQWIWLNTCSKYHTHLAIWRVQFLFHMPEMKSDVTVIHTYSCVCLCVCVHVFVHIHAWYVNVKFIRKHTNLSTSVSVSFTIRWTRWSICFCCLGIFTLNASSK